MNISIHHSYIKLYLPQTIVKPLIRQLNAILEAASCDCEGVRIQHIEVGITLHHTNIGCEPLPTIDQFQQYHSSSIY